jgi:hypothetical protein
MTRYILKVKKYFPNLSVRNVSTHYDLTEKPRFFINYKKKIKVHIVIIVLRTC